MPRRAEIQPRQVTVDPVHGSVLVQQLINRVMLDGKKSVAEQVVYDALAQVAEKSERSASPARRSVPWRSTAAIWERLGTTWREA